MKQAIPAGPVVCPTPPSSSCPYLLLSGVIPDIASTLEAACTVGSALGDDIALRHDGSRTHGAGRSQYRLRRAPQSLAVSVERPTKGGEAGRAELPASPNRR